MTIQDLLAQETPEQISEDGMILHVIRTFGINKREYDLLEVIHNYTLQYGWCFLPLKMVSKEAKISRALLYKLLPHLIKVGLLEKNIHRPEIMRTTKIYLNNTNGL